MALSLTRKTGDSILIGDSIRITITQIRGSAVQLSIDAPRGVPIVRSELLARKKEENKP